MRYVVAAAMLAMSAPTLAQDANGYRSITAGNLGQAEQELLAQRQSYPARPELMLNLAFVYARTARAEQARALYREVLARRTVAMDLPNGAVVSSHSLAQAGLARLAPTTIAAR